jgi:hypothetical protein
MAEKTTMPRRLPAQLAAIAALEDAPFLSTSVIDGRRWAPTSVYHFGGLGRPTITEQYIGL